MPRKSNTVGPTGERLAANVVHERQVRGMAKAELSRRLDEVGRPMSLDVITKVEAATRPIDVDDLVALATVFDVSPVKLLFRDADNPHVGDWIEVTPAVRRRAQDVLDWALQRDPESREQEVRDLIAQLVRERDEARDDAGR